MNVFYEKDADLQLLRNTRVAVIGYGSQGHAQAQNLRDSGIEVVIGLREGSGSWAKAVAAGFEVHTVRQAVEAASLVVMLVPDETAAQVYWGELHEALPKNATLLFAHGFNIHFGQINPREDLDVVMVAPKAPGHTVRATYEGGGGVPALISVARDVSGRARDVALAYATAIGCGRSGVIETSFADETETDLFGEQVVLCGGMVELVKAGFETLTEAGYSPELAYFECLHELKLIVDLLYEGGIGTLNYGISNNAEFGEYVTGPRIITDETKAAMRDVLDDIRSGDYAKQFILESRAGAPVLHARRFLDAAHPIEKVGAQLRSMMPWISKDALVDRARN